MHYYGNKQEQCSPAVGIPYPGYCPKLVVEVLHAGIGFVQGGYIKQCQNRAGKKLNNKEEKRDPSKEMMPMRWFDFHN